MSREITWQGHHGPRVDTVNDFDVIDCEICGFRHIVPIPTEAELEELYRHAYYTKDKPLSIDRQNEDADWLEMTHGERFDTFSSLLGKPAGRVLDIGCGPGFFLLAGKRKGWECVGVEPSVEAAAHARSLGIEVVEGVLTPEMAGSLGEFDAIHLHQVLEHVPDPAAMVGLACTMLVPGGVVMATVPNDYNPVQDAYVETSGAKKWWLAPPHHINYFTHESFSRLFDRCGLAVEDVTGSFPIDFFLLMGEKYVGNDTLGRECHGRRKAFEMALHATGRDELRKDLYRALAGLGLGREVIVTARLTQPVTAV